MTSVVCEWGLAGIEHWKSRASVFVIVDVLSFSTAVSVAVDRGASVLPFASGDPDAAAAEALRRGAIAASARRASGSQFTLSPESLSTLPAGAKLLLPSPNGSRLSLATGEVATLCGSLRNVEAVAKAAGRMAGTKGLIAVIAAGERWPDQTLRPAVEDWLGAGAIIRYLAADESAEATLARLAFEATGAGLQDLVRGCWSGRELIDRGFPQDVEIALEVNSSGSAPRLTSDGYCGL